MEDVGTAARVAGMAHDGPPSERSSKCVDRLTPTPSAQRIRSPCHSSVTMRRPAPYRHATARLAPLGRGVPSLNPHHPPLLSQGTPKSPAQRARHLSRLGSNHLTLMEISYDRGRAPAEALPYRRAHATSPPATRGRSTMRHANAGGVPSLGARWLWFPREGSAAKSRGSFRCATRLSERMGDASI